MFIVTTKHTQQLRRLYGGLESLPRMVLCVTYPSLTAETVPRLEFFSRLDRLNGTLLAEVDEDNRRHRIYLARMPGVASTGDSTGAVLVNFTTKAQ